jgi:hypothetical protein
LFLRPSFFPFATPCLLCPQDQSLLQAIGTTLE